MRSWAALALVGALAGGLAAGASLGEAHATKAKCRRHHHRRVCRTVHVKPRALVTTTTSTTTTSTGSGLVSSAPGAGPATTTTTVQTSTTQTTTTSSTSPALPHGTEVDERATGLQSPLYALNAYQRTLAAGAIHFNIYNYDQDPHTFAIADSGGAQITPDVQVPSGHAGTAVPVTVDLPPGTYVLFCTLPLHAADGMQATIVVR